MIVTTHMKEKKGPSQETNYAQGESVNLENVIRRREVTPDSQGDCKDVGAACLIHTRLPPSLPSLPLPVHSSDWSSVCRPRTAYLFRAAELAYLPHHLPLHLPPVSFHLPSTNSCLTFPFLPVPLPVPIPYSPLPHPLPNPLPNANALQSPRPSIPSLPLIPYTPPPAQRLSSDSIPTNNSRVIIPFSSCPSPFIASSLLTSLRPKGHEGTRVMLRRG